MKKIEEILGPNGRLLGMSKGRLRYSLPNDLIVFNSNVYIGQEKVWYGDLNISDEHDLNMLKTLAESGTEIVHVLDEAAGKFSNKDGPDFSDPVISITNNGTSILGHALQQYYSHDGQRTILMKKYQKPRELNELELITEIGIPISKESIYQQFELPSLDMFKAKNMSSQEVPFLKFYTHIANKLNVNLITLSVSTVILNLNTSQNLNALVLDQLKKEFKTDFYSIQKNYSMLSLGYGPVATDAEWAKNNIVYIRK